MRKQAIWSKPEGGVNPLPVGDNGLPEQLTEKDIPGGIDSNIDSKKQGETDITVNWLDFEDWYSEAGESLPEILLGRDGSSNVKLFYIYSYDNSNIAEDIKPIRMVDSLSGKIITDPYLIESLAQYYDDQIQEDISGVVENSPERNPDYNFFAE